MAPAAFFAAAEEAAAGAVLRRTWCQCQARAPTASTRKIAKAMTAPRRGEEREGDVEIKVVLVAVRLPEVAPPATVVEENEERRGEEVVGVAVGVSDTEEVRDGVREGVGVMEEVEDAKSTEGAEGMMAASKESAVSYPMDWAMPEAARSVTRVPSVKMEVTRVLALVAERRGLEASSCRACPPPPTAAPPPTCPEVVESEARE